MILIEEVNRSKKILAYNIDRVLVARECTKCFEFLNIKEFRKSDTKSTGYASCCKVCERIPNRIRSAVYCKKSEVKVHRKLYKSTEAYKLKNKKYNKKSQEKRNKWKRENRERYRDKNKQYTLIYKKNSSEKYYLRCKKRKLALKNSRIIKTESIKKEINNIFDRCKELKKLTGIKYEVDHIIPLQGETVSGLTVPWNLEILTRAQNIFKLNKFDGTYDNQSWKKDYE